MNHPESAISFNLQFNQFKRYGHLGIKWQTYEEIEDYILYLWRRKLYVLVMIIVSDGKTSRHLFFCVLTRSVFYILILFYTPHPF